MAERVFNLPDLGEGLEDAEVVEWKVVEGDEVELNQPLVEVNTAKALVEIPSPVAGTIRTLHGAVGDQIPVGAPLVTFEVAEGTAPSAEGEAAAAAGQRATPQPKREAVLVGYGVEEDGGGGRRRPRLRPPGPRKAAGAVAAPEASGIRATPPVRRLARERGVDLATIRGTGQEGRITRDDVIRAASSFEPGAAQAVEGRPAAEDAPSAPPAVATAGGGPPGEAPSTRSSPQREAGERIPLKGVRRLIAEKMTRSWREIPHVTTFHRIDATNIEALRRELSDEHGTRVSALAVVTRALVDVCGRHPLLNSSLDDQEIQLHSVCHVGIAADTDRGLMVPVVRDADAKGITQLAREIADVVEAARSGRATPAQLTGSTITVSNVGTFGSSYGTPIINAPEASILALGRIEQGPVAVDGGVEARPTVTLSLSFDHRILDGADADRAMTELRGILESPFRLGALPR